MEIERERANTAAWPIAILAFDYFNSKTEERVVEVDRYLPHPPPEEPKVPLSREEARLVLRVIESGSVHGKWIGVLGEELAEIEKLAGS
jgi:hypothetical protein